MFAVLNLQTSRFFIFLSYENISLSYGYYLPYLRVLSPLVMKLSPKVTKLSPKIMKLSFGDILLL